MLFRGTTVRKSTPEGFKIGPLEVPHGLGEAPGRLFCASCAQLGRQGRSEAVFWAALGALLGRFWRAWSCLEASWAAPGASRAAPGRLLGVVLSLPGG